MKEVAVQKKRCSCKAEILIVDDNIFNLIPLRMMISEMFSLEVDQALNGLEAVVKFTKNLEKSCCQTNYKLVLMDLNMPVMDGYDSTVQILSKFHDFYSGVASRAHSVNVVAVTAFVNEENIAKCYEVGMKEVIHKPLYSD